MRARADIVLSVGLKRKKEKGDERRKEKREKTKERRGKREERTEKRE